MNTSDYSSESIKVLKGLEAVRKRPGMYIGDTDDGSGLHHMIYEVVDNSIDEALAGFCNKITVLFNVDGSVTVKDNGRGVPVEIHESEGVSAAQVIMTELHAGGKFDQKSYKVSGGLHGVGVSVVNALSEWCKAEIYRDKKTYTQEYKIGIAQNTVQNIGPTEKRGSKITFKPDYSVFVDQNYNPDTIKNRLKELSFLNSGTKIIFKHKNEE